MARFFAILSVLLSLVLPAQNAVNDDYDFGFSDVTTEEFNSAYKILYGEKYKLFITKHGMYPHEVREPLLRTKKLIESNPEKKERVQAIETLLKVYKK